MAKNIEVSEPDENMFRYPKIEVNTGEGIKGNIELPESDIKYEKPWLSENIKFGLWYAGAVCVAYGFAVGAISLSEYYEKKPFRDNSYKVSRIGWELKSVVGGDYIYLASSGTLEIYPYSFMNFYKQVELVDFNLDGLVDVVKTFRDKYTLNKKLVRGQTGNTAVFEDADQKYKDYREKLAGLIAKAEKAWRQQ